MTDSQPAPSMQPLPTTPAPQGPRRGNPAGIAALLIALVALIFGAIGLIGVFTGLPGWLVTGVLFIGALFAFIAVVVGIVALVLRNRRKIAAAAGLILGIVAGLTVIVAAVVAVVGVFNTGKNAYDSVQSQFASAFPSGLPTDFGSDLPSTLPSDLQSLLPSAGPALAAGQHTVVYTVTGSGSAEVSYNSSLDTDGATSPSQQTLPFEKSVTVTSSGGSESIFNLDVIGSDGSGSVGCKITVDGTVIAEKTSSSTLRFAVCAATLGQ